MPNNLLGSQIAGGNSAYAKPSMEFYPTPPEVTFALLRELNIPENCTIWEPACGEMDMVDEMRKWGYRVYATDLTTGVDFLAQTECTADWIITNPPFSRSEEFIERCAAFGRPFALLLKSQYWHAAKRQELFKKHPPSVIMPLTWRPNFFFKSHGGGSPLMEVAWNVWFPMYTGTTVYKPIGKGEKQ